MKELLSIVVPIYNAELYLDECIMSIRKQKYENIEIILVDDGSTDDSLHICEQHAIEDERIIVIHQENQGRVKARKVGIEAARGEYIGFVDSDDWIDDIMYDYLMQIAENTKADMVTSGCFKEYEGSRSIEFDSFSEKCYETEEDMEYLYSNFLLFEKGIEFGLSYSMWNKIFRKEITKKVIFTVPENIWAGEDTVFISLYLLQCKRVYCCRKAFYHYRMRGDSTVHTPRPDYLIPINSLYQVLKKEFAISRYNECLNRQLDKLMVKLVLSGLNGKMGLGAEVKIPWYGFDEKRLSVGKIVLYGAGAVGKEYCAQIKRCLSIEIVLWVDKKYEKYRAEGYEVHKVGDIQNVCYDKILIATRNEYLAEEIKKELVKDYLIPEDKMVWLEPQMLYFNEV